MGVAAVTSIDRWCSGWWWWPLEALLKMGLKAVVIPESLLPTPPTIALLIAALPSTVCLWPLLAAIAAVLGPGLTVTTVGVFVNWLFMTGCGCCSATASTTADSLEEVERISRRRFVLVTGGCSFDCNTRTAADLGCCCCCWGKTETELWFCGCCCFIG